MEELADEFKAWCEEHGLPHQDANELLLLDGTGKLHTPLSPAERYWLEGFIARWDRQQRILDRIAGLCLVAC
jgi:hypothetical protein